MGRRRGDYEEALRRAQEALEYTRAHDLVQLGNYASVLVGLVEVKLGQPEAARQHLLAGLANLEQRAQTLQALYGLAAIAASTGQPERAAELAVLVQQHRATEYEFKVYAGELLAGLQAVIPPATYADAVERGAALDSDEVVRATLQENETLADEDRN